MSQIPPPGPQPWQPPKPESGPQPWLPPGAVTPPPLTPPPAPEPSGPQVWQPPGAASAAGFPMPEPAAQAGPPQFEPQIATPMSKKAKRRVTAWVGAGVGLAVLIGGAVIAVSMINDSRDPAAQVETYLTLLEDGKAKRASDMVKHDASDDTLLTDAVLQSADHRIKVRSVETIERSGNGATVRAKLSLNGERFERDFDVKSGPAELLFLETWELEDPFVVKATIGLNAPMSAGSVPATVTVAGTDVTLAETMTGADEASVFVYPGVYEVTAGDLGKYLSSDDTTLIADASDDQAVVEVNASLNEAFETEILAQAAAYADGCVSISGNGVVSSNMDAACPSITRNTQLASLQVIDRPEALWESDAKSFITDDFEFEVTSSLPSGRSDRSSSALSGSITWSDGVPKVVDATFGGW